MEPKTIDSYRRWHIPIATGQPKTLAAVDIGTNTVLFACVWWSASVFELVCDYHRIARLGEGIQESGAISEAALQRTIRILREYRQLCETHHCTAIAAVATSALRRATNRSVVQRQLEAALQSPITIISGEEEAKLTYRGSVDPETPSQRCAVLDIGGGSTEVATGRGWTPDSLWSLELGVVRLTEKFFPDFPPTDAQRTAAQQEIRRKLQSLPPQDPGRVFAVGGTPTTLAALALRLPRFDPAAVHHYHLSINQIEHLATWIFRQPLATLQAHPVIHPDRADVLPAGTLILLEFLRHTQTSHCIVSARGLRFGVLLQLAHSLSDAPDSFPPEGS